VSPSETAVLAFWREHRDQLRQSETQRALLTNYLLVIAAALSALIVQQRFALATLPLSVLITVVGFYGAVSAAKYHERAEYHLMQARALTRALTEMGVLADQVGLDQARRDHYRRIHGCTRPACITCGPVCIWVLRDTGSRWWSSRWPIDTVPGTRCIDRPWDVSQVVRWSGSVTG
jgi:hypothetical protein